MPVYLLCHHSYHDNNGGMAQMLIPCNRAVIACRTNAESAADFLVEMGLNSA